MTVLWRDRWLGVTVAVAIAAAYGLSAAWVTPRGPMTAAQGLTAMVAGLAVGVASGFVMRSRWAMLLAPLVFAGAFELARVGSEGPTVDAPDLGSLLSILVAAVGRGFHGILVILPMVMGAALGAARARRMRGQPAARPGHWGSMALIARRGIALVVTIGLVLMAVFLARPGDTAPIVGGDGQPLLGSVAEITRASIGGHDLSMMIRGNDVTNPVLLFLAGGPGGAELGAMRNHGQALEQDFVVVTLDQRGTGKSYDQIEPTSNFTCRKRSTTRSA